MSDTLASSPEVTVTAAELNGRRLAALLRQARTLLISGADRSADTRDVMGPVLEALREAEARALGAAPVEAATPSAAEHQALLQAVAVRDEFIAVLGHELKNPLSPIVLQTQLLLEASTTAGEGEGMVSAGWLTPRLATLNKRLQKFVGRLNQLLEVSRAGSAEVELKWEEVDLSELVRDVAASFEREFAAARTSVVLDIPGPQVGHWDRLRLEQIAGNLISNAIRYGASKPVEVRVEGDEDEVRLVVRDHGIGIAQENLEVIFERFQRVSGRSLAGGFGLGLWLVRRLCDALGAEVAVESRVGAGSAFTVSLPRRKGSL